MTQEEREAILRDAEALLDTVFASRSFISTQALIDGLRSTGNPVYEGYGDNRLAQLISSAMRGTKKQVVVDGRRKMGYRPSDIRNAYQGPECCRPDSVAYKYRHQMIKSVKGLASAQECTHCPEQAQVWATIHGSCPEHSLTGYMPLCSKCHAIYDSQHYRVDKAEVTRTGISGNLRRIIRTMDELLLQLRDLATELEERE